MKHLLIVCLVSACEGSDTVSSDEQARRAYLGLDQSIGKSITLGFDGFNSAQSANISPQMVNGDSAGTLTITGQVDQGASANKGMRLYVGMVGYTDGAIKVNDKGDTIHVTYDTSTTQADQPYLQMSLKNIPTGTLMAGPSNTVVRVPGSTHVTGTATSGNGMYMVDVTI